MARKRPICPSCGKPSIMTDDRFGGKYECPDCDMWAWGGKPLKTRAENKAARDARKPRTVIDIDLSDDRPEWAVLLGVEYPTTMAEVMKQYRRKAMVAHPDRGGSVEQMQALVEARNAAKIAIEGLKLGDPIQEVDLG